jgi:hypothetical protein
MHIDVVPNRTSRPAYLLRETYREGGKVKKRTVANLSALSDDQIRMIRAALKGESLYPLETLFKVTESRGHGHVQAVQTALSKLGMTSLLASRASRERERVLAMLTARILAPQTKLATTRWWHTTTLAEEFGVSEATEAELYAAMDSARTPSRRNSLRAISAMTAGFSTICPQATSKAQHAPWLGAATTATARRARCRSTTGCSPIAGVARSPCRSTRAIPRTRTR